MLKRVFKLRVACCQSGYFPVWRKRVTNRQPSNLDVHILIKGCEIDHLQTPVGLIEQLLNPQQHTVPAAPQAHRGDIAQMPAGCSTAHPVALLACGLVKRQAAGSPGNGQAVHMHMHS